MKLVSKACLALMAASALTCASMASADCKLTETAEFHVDAGSASPIVEGEINGHPVRVLFDTGRRPASCPSPKPDA